MNDCDNCGHAAIDHQADGCWIENEETQKFCTCTAFEPEEDDDEHPA